MLCIAPIPTLDALYNSALKPASPQHLSSLCPQEKGDSDIIMLVFRVFLIFKTVISSTAITSYATISPLSMRRYCCSCLLLNGIAAVQCKLKHLLELFYLWIVLLVFWCLLWLCKLVTACIMLTCTTILNYKRLNAVFNPRVLHIHDEEKCPVCWVCTTNQHWHQKSSLLYQK